mgnify:CR=1 FL=1
MAVWKSFTGRIDGEDITMKITKLTPEQESKIEGWAKKWIDIGLSTEPADFGRATEAALRAYALCNLDKPMVVLRLGSPYAATIGGAIAWLMLRNLLDTNQVRAQVGAQVRDQVRDQVRAQVWAQVGAQVWDQVRDQVRAQVWSQVGDQVRAQVGAQVWDQVWDQVRDQVWDQVGVVTKDGFSNYGVSSLWSEFTALVTFFRDVCGWGNAEILGTFEINEALVSSVGWTWWHQNVLALSDRPKSIKRDNNNRLHCENGPSIEYRDGWSLWHWHGVSIPKEWVLDKSCITPEIALTWKNIEQRRAACEILGWKHILAALNARVIDADEDEVGTLLEADIPDSGLERFLKVKCGTGREFVLPVPREMQTAVQANLWTYGIDATVHSYLPEVRT